MVGTERILAKKGRAFKPLIYRNMFLECNIIQIVMFKLSSMVTTGLNFMAFDWVTIYFSQSDMSEKSTQAWPGYSTQLGLF